MTQYSKMTNDEFIAYLKKYMIDGCHPQICTEAAERLEKATFLPCETGNAVYIISRKRIKKCEVVYIGISADKNLSHLNFVENYADGTYRRSYARTFDCIGNNVFLTRKEAEKALKERESNA